MIISLRHRRFAQGCGCFLLLIAALTGSVTAGVAPGRNDGAMALDESWLDRRFGLQESSLGLRVQTRTGAGFDLESSSNQGVSYTATIGADMANASSTHAVLAQADESEPSQGLGSSSEALSSRIDINSADAVELAAALPGIGPRKAQAIIEWRDVNGPFRSVEQLLEVSGIGPVTLQNIRPYIHLGSGRRIGTLQRHLPPGERDLLADLAKALARVEKDRRAALSAAGVAE